MKDIHTTNPDDFINPVIRNLNNFEQDLVRIADNHKVTIDPNTMMEGNSKMYDKFEDAKDAYENPEVALLLQYIERKFLECGE